MASVVIRKVWFSRPSVNVMKVPTSGVGPPQVSEAAFLDSLGAAGLRPGTRTTQAAGAVTVGNVVSSTPAAGANANQGAQIAYLVSI